MQAMRRIAAITFTVQNHMSLFQLLQSVMVSMTVDTLMTNVTKSVILPIDKFWEILD
jgi:hypothetical protein